MNKAATRRAFTIVELLVVAAIIASLFGLVLAGLRPNVAGNVRRAARQLSSSILASQSIAIGSPAGAAVLFEADDSPSAAVRIREAYVPPRIAATVAAAPFADASFQLFQPQFTLNALTPINASPADLASGYRIRFRTWLGPWSPWYAFQSIGPTGATALVSLRLQDGQSPENTVWPCVPANADVEISRYPKPGQIAAELPKTVGIDLRYSGCGDDPGSTWGGLAGKGLVGLTFDTVGRIETLVQNVSGGSRPAQPCFPVQPVYFFIVPRDLLLAETTNPAAAGQSTLASDTAVWVVVHPETGRVVLAANVPQAVTAGQLATPAQLRAARADARAAVSLEK